MIAHLIDEGRDRQLRDRGRASLPGSGPGSEEIGRKSCLWVRCGRAGPGSPGRRTEARHRWR